MSLLDYLQQLNKKFTSSEEVSSFQPSTMNPPTNTGTFPYQQTSALTGNAPTQTVNPKGNSTTQNKPVQTSPAKKQEVAPKKDVTPAPVNNQPGLQSVGAVGGNTFDVKTKMLQPTHLQNATAAQNPQNQQQAQTGQTVAAPAATTSPDETQVGTQTAAGATTNPNNPFTTQQQAEQAKTDQLIADHQKAITDLISGPIPLTPEDQQKVTDIQANSNMLIDALTEASRDNAQAAMAGISSSGGRIDSEMMANSNLAALQKVSMQVLQINQSTTSQINDIKAAARTNDIALVDTKYKELIANQEAKSAALTAAQQTVFDNKIKYDRQKLSETNASNLATYRAGELVARMIQANKVSSTNQLPNQALIDGIKSGAFDPTKINSRTINLYNSMAEAGVNAVDANATAAARVASVKQLTGYANMSTNLQSIVDANIPSLAQLADKVNTGDVPLLNRYVNGLSINYNGEDMNVVRYLNQLTTIRREYANMLSKNGVAHENAVNEASDAIPAGLTGAGYTSLGQQLNLENQYIRTATTDTLNLVKQSPTGVPIVQAAKQAPVEEFNTFYNAADPTIQANIDDFMTNNPDATADDVMSVFNTNQ